MQLCYHVLKNKINKTGITNYGGLFGGAAVVFICKRQFLTGYDLSKKFLRCQKNSCVCAGMLRHCMRKMS